MAYDTALDIANLALFELGEPVMSSWSDSGQAAAKMLQVFKKEFRSMLKAPEVEWLWARRYAELTQDSVLTHYTEWDYVYDPPSDLLVILDVYDPNSMSIIWELVDDHIMCDYEPYTDTDSNSYPRIAYTADPFTAASDPTFESWVSVPDEFANAVAVRIAWKMAKPLTKDSKRIEALRSEYLFIALPEAERVNAMYTPGFGEPAKDWSEIQEGTVSRSSRYYRKES